MIRTAAQPTRKPLVLLVEDDYDTRRMIAQMLASMAEVVTAADGEDALERMDARRPDLVITDLMMPKLDGLGFVRALKTDPAFARVPVLMVTAKDLPRDIVDGINAGARYYMTKPFTSAALVDRVRRALAKRT